MFGKSVFKTQLSLLLLWAGSVEATTGLTALSGLIWLFYFIVGLAILAVAIIATYLWKYSRGASPGRLFKIISSVSLFLGSPVLLVAFFSFEFSAAWFATLLLYLAVLTVGLLSMVRNRSIVFGVVGAILLVYLNNVMHIVSFTEYVIEDNTVFYQPQKHDLAEQLGSRAFRTSKNLVYRSTDSRSSIKYLPVGAPLVMAKESGSQSNEDVYTVKSIRNSREFVNYKKKRFEPWLTLPFRSITIETNQADTIGRFEFIGYFDSLHQYKWIATNQELVDALLNNCCNEKWITALVEHGVDPAEVTIGARNPIQFFAADVHRYTDVVQTSDIFIKAGIDINQKDQRGHTPLYLAVDGAANRYFRDPVLSTRFIAFVTMLLDAGADPNAGDEFEITPLYRAVSAKRIDLAHVLLEYGADPRATNSANKYSPLTLAQGRLRNAEDKIQKEALSALILKMQNAAH